MRPACAPLVALLAAAGCSGGAAPRSGAVVGDGTQGLALPPSVCGTPAPPATWPGPTVTVGSGTVESCTEAALDAALAGGGRIGFACGPVPVVLYVSREKVITRDTWLDGGGLVTLSGGGATRILAIRGLFTDAGPRLRLERLGLRDGRASGTATPLGTGVDGGGGAVFHQGGAVTAVDCLFLDNAAATWGPDVAGGAISGVGNPASTEVYRSVFRGNRAANGGALGSLHTALTVVDSLLEANEAAGRGANSVDAGGQQVGHGGDGGAISMDGEHRTLTVCGSALRANRAGAFGGALFRTSYHEEPTTIDRSALDANAVADEPGSGAGAAYLQGTRVTVTASTVSRNRAAAAPGLRFHDMGTARARADLANVTIAENAVYDRPDPNTNGLGGGLWTVGIAGTLDGVTIAGNRAGFAAGILGHALLTIRNGVISNVAANRWVDANCHDATAGAVAGGDHVLQWAGAGAPADGDCVAGAARGDPLLGPLGDHGGPTETAVPAAGSQALAAGASCQPVDQRGVTRPAACTLGAVEPP
ncbi:MAG TPA: choice-of-anchor Q domain-containing protein [Anaeromyxobacteraceae bacterium]|nr:choice-of-anchor Q domain-containing protein [Anaeromyxobacteraceae bacterium]